MPNITLSFHGRYNFNSTITGSEEDVSFGGYVLTLGKTDLDAVDNSEAINALVNGDFVGLAQANGSIGVGATIVGVIDTQPTYRVFTVASSTWGTLAEMVDIAVIAVKRDATVDYPEIHEVLNGVSFGDNGALTGNITLPAVGEVRVGILFGGNSGLNGTLTLPGQGDVANGTQYGANGTEFTGTLTKLAAYDVRNGVQYGANGTEFTGNLTLPAVGDVQEGILYGGNGTDFNGTFAVPSEGDVADGVQFGAGGTEFTGNAGLFPAAASSQLAAIFDKLPSSDYLAGSDENDGSIPTGSGGSGMLTLDITSVLASTAPLTLPAATTSLSALMTANSLTFNNATIALYLQPQNGTMYLDPAGSNATANGTIVSQNQTVRLSKAANNNDTNLGSIHVARGAAGAAVKIICE